MRTPAEVAEMLRPRTMVADVARRWQVSSRHNRPGSARVKIELVNLAYNMRRFAWISEREVLA